MRHIECVFIIEQQFEGKQRVKTWSRFYFLICTALLDELLIEVFRHFSLKEIVTTLSKVSKRWYNISDDRWVSGIVYLLVSGTFTIWPKLSFWTLFHTSGLFSHFSMSYVDVKVSQSRLNEILLNSLQVAQKLTHLSRVHIRPRLWSNYNRNGFTSTNYSPWFIIGLQLVPTTPRGLFEVITVRD